MLVPLSVKVSTETRDRLTALAEAQNTNPSALARSLINRYFDGVEDADSNLLPLIQANFEDVTRALVLIRFLAEGVDKDTTDILLERTDAYLASRIPSADRQFDGSV
ncbi:hypothetical protein [Kordiimonas aquimaris]|uniref:hypothetical protein n=1 Tax=Kordiimonas aquimaris TaxID=707591 RepID=UPI0021D05D90|nr:hypothetical protein [Kordiimonas aquimaris]